MKKSVKIKVNEGVVEKLAKRGGGGIQARIIELKFPRFDETELLDWILKVEQFFSYG